ncbi:MAG: DUF362 domain-containing protein [Phycisphaerae bacterium]|nr:DUF362 domain-containing protein [Phycisphaerae bacterium]NUQ44433.1 DUF362 domain-containing protein [Phycisphaerae bacterium]
MLNRRQFLKATAATGAAALLGGCRFSPRPTTTPGRALILPASDYARDLTELILDGLREFPELSARGKSVLLKPNLVETTTSERPINTHPAVVVAAAEAFRRMDAASIVVADGPGHRRDIELVLAQSGLGRALQEADLDFVDLNHDAVAPVGNAGRRTILDKLYLPRTVLEADLVVSLAKLKTHHWAGATLSMKNCFGLMPGIVYGWPKNVLHRSGRPKELSIPQAIVDIVQTVRPGFAIIDGIVGMEGDGPIMGSAKPVGCLVMGDQFASVDATAAAIMGFQPHRIDYLRYADRAGLGGTNPAVLQQRGEPISLFRTDFAVLPHFAALKSA